MTHLRLVQCMRLHIDHKSQLRTSLQWQPSVLPSSIVPHILTCRYILIMVRSDFLLLGIHNLLESGNPWQFAKIPIGPLVRHEQRLHHATIVEGVGFFFSLKVLVRRLLHILNLLFLNLIKKRCPFWQNGLPLHPIHNEVLLLTLIKWLLIPNIREFPADNPTL